MSTRSCSTSIHSAFQWDVFISDGSANGSASCPRTWGTRDWGGWMTYSLSHEPQPPEECSTDLALYITIDNLKLVSKSMKQSSYYCFFSTSFLVKTWLLLYSVSLIIIASIQTVIISGRNRIAVLYTWQYNTTTQPNFGTMTSSYWLHCQSQDLWSTLKTVLNWLLGIVSEL